MKPTRLASWTLALCVTFALGAFATEPATSRRRGTLQWTGIPVP